MGYPDIERLREGQAALQRLVDGYVGPGADLRALRRMVDVCREMSEATDDEYCREKIRVIVEYAAELLSQGEHRPRGALPGIDWLRQQIRGALELLQSRLYSLERARRVGQAGFVRPSYGTLHPR